MPNTPGAFFRFDVIFRPHRRGTVAGPTCPVVGPLFDWLARAQAFRDTVGDWPTPNI